MFSSNRINGGGRYKNLFVAEWLDRHSEITLEMMQYFRMQDQKQRRDHNTLIFIQSVSFLL